MAVGIEFPIPNPLRDFPVDPMVHGDTEQDAPLPFQLGAGASEDIDSTYIIRPLFTTVISAIEDPNNPDDGGTGTGTGAGCNPITNQFCVPRGTFTIDSVPVGTFRCSIT